MNIEKTISEHAVSDILTPMLESQDRIVTEDVAPLFEQATGLDTPPASGTVTTTIEESRSVISAIIRKAWTATLTMLGGASVLSSIAAAYTYLRTRLQGNETYGIPDRRSEISASSPLAANLALLNDRKIGGVPEAADGMSLVQLICADYNGVTELEDNTTWESGKNINTLVSLFPNLAKVVWGARSHSGSLVTNATGLTELELPNLRTVSMVTGNPLIRNIGVEELTLHITSYQNYFAGCVMGCTNLRKLTFDELESIRLTNDNDNRMIGDCSALEEVYAEKLGNVYVYRSTDHPRNGFVSNCAALKKLCFGDVTSWTYRGIDRETGAPNLIDLRFKSVSCSLDLGYWNPTNVLQNNLQQFLSNFKTYIAERLADNGSGKTLTLSQAVFSEIWDSQGQPQVKEDGLDQLRADIHRIIRTVKQWAVNKA